MKIYTLIITVFFIFISTYCLPSADQRTLPRAVKGTLDLRNWDFEKDGPVELNGEWEFYWLRHLNPEEFKSKTLPGISGMITVPGSWNKYRIGGKALPAEGFATYRLRIILPLKNSNGHKTKVEKLHGKSSVTYALKLRNIDTAYKVYINDTMLTSNGMPGTSGETSSAEWRPHVAQFSATGDEIDVVLHISNFIHRNGGPFNSITFGLNEDIRLLRERRLMIEMFLFGTIFIIGLYHVGFFVLRRKDRSPLYFGIFCLLLGFRILVLQDYEIILIYLFPSISAVLISKIGYLCYYLAVPFFIMYVHAVFTEEFKTFIVRFSQIAAALFATVVIITPLAVYTRINIYYHAITILLCVYTIYTILIAAFRKKTEALILLAGFIIFSLAIINDILYNIWILRIGTLSETGLLLFLFSQAFLISFRFSGAFTAVENLSAELGHKNVELTHVKNFLTKIIDSMPSLIIGVDTEGKINQWNLEANRFMDITHKWVIGKPLLEALPWLSDYKEKVWKAIHDGEIQKTERIKQEIGGLARVLDLMVYPLSADIVEGAVIRIDDITSRVRIEEMMVQTEKMMSIGGLAGGMAHEINNPLGGILLGITNILRRVSPDLQKNEEVAAECGTRMASVFDYMEKREIIKMVNGIKEMAERAAHIVSNMLNFSRKSETSMSPKSLSELMDKAADLSANDYDLKKNFDFRRIRIFREYDPDMPNVPCNGTEIEQVILNLLKNAAHAMAGAQIDAPRITLRLRRDGSMAQIEVEDNGPGMSGEVMKRAFEPFFTTKEAGIGTGLGLSVSHHIITDNHKGEMTVVSSPGNGARFIIRIPLSLEGIERRDARSCVSTSP